MPRPRPDRRPRPHRARSGPEAMIDARALQVLVGDRDDVELAIVDLRRKTLVETHRTGQRYPNHARNLTDLEESWSVEVTFSATDPGRWAVTFQHLPPAPKPRVRQASLDLDNAVVRSETAGDAALRMRLHRIERPWREYHLQHVTNFVHAELHGCAAVDVQGHPIPTSRYYEIDVATARSGRLVRHGATLNGLDLGYNPARRLILDSD